MGLVRQLLQRLPSKKTLDEIAQYHRLSPRLAFLRRRIRLKGSSTITMPLGMVLLFPFTIVMLLLVLFVRHPNSPGRMLMPSSGPPAIRYVQKTERSEPPSFSLPPLPLPPTTRSHLVHRLLHAIWKLDGLDSLADLRAPCGIDG